MIALDKAAHALGGYAVAMTLALVSTPIEGLFYSTVLWGAKEGIDAMGYGTPDKWDFVASVIGAVLAYLFLTVV